MNKCVISGRLTRDPELKTTNSNISVSSNCLAVKRKTRGENGEYGVDFIDFTAWKQAAEYLCNYGHKGDSVAVMGEIRVIKYEDKNGNKKSKFEVQAHEIELTFTKSAADKQQDVPQEAPPVEQSYADASDDDLPF